MDRYTKEKILRKIQYLEDGLNEVREILNSDRETDGNLRFKIVDLIKKSENKGGIKIKEIEEKLNYPKKEINKEIVKLLEQGEIFEPRSAKVRYLG